ncbi:MAG: prepilin-type N-terminal cleavage/methylation domain-containing protein [Verrucomicrobiota bacterium]|nr:prepilin-type N-terminal cleavage/methylation domain-containing protein [Verrucomicrobiota bacterium]
MKKSGCGSRRAAAFTLLELVIVVVIVGILATMLLPVYAGMRTRAQRVQCVGNLHSLFLAADLYLQRNGSWPQIRRSTSDNGSADFANAWIDALSQFGPTRQTWICPAVQEILHDPDYLKEQNARVDYIPMSFDDKPTTPHQWARQPWFIESADVHGNGNLIIFTDGSIAEVNDVVPK